jgi:hypothetical protein
VKSIGKDRASALRIAETRQYAPELGPFVIDWLGVEERMRG